MLETARKDQRERAQRLCDLASYSTIKYTLPDGELYTSRILGKFRTYWVIGTISETGQEFLYGLSAQDGSYRGHWPEQSMPPKNYDIVLEKYDLLGGTTS